MTDDFVGVIHGALGALDPYRDQMRVSTDDLSTLLVGSTDVIFPAMRDLFVAAASSGKHCVLHATVSRGCPGEPDDPICTPSSSMVSALPLEERKQAALVAVRETPLTGETVSAQFSLYVLGIDQHMGEIYGCIDFLKHSGVFHSSKNFCTKLRGDAGAVFATINEAFCRFGPTMGHVTLDISISAHSPSSS